MADRKVIVNGAIYTEQATRKVIINGRIYEETISVATGLPIPVAMKYYRNMRK